MTYIAGVSTGTWPTSDVTGHGEGFLARVSGRRASRDRGGWFVRAPSESASRLAGRALFLRRRLKAETSSRPRRQGSEPNAFGQRPVNEPTELSRTRRHSRDSPNRCRAAEAQVGAMALHSLTWKRSQIDRSVMRPRQRAHFEAMQAPQVGVLGQRMVNG